MAGEVVGWKTSSVTTAAAAAATVERTWRSVCDELDRNASATLDRLRAQPTTTATHVDVQRVVQFLIPIFLAVQP